MSDRIFDPTIGALNTALNLRLANQNVIASNVANADTPGYKAKTMEFENALRTSLGLADMPPPVRTHPEHRAPTNLDPVHPIIYDDPNGVESIDGNTVDRAGEMAKMSENQLLYDAAVEMLKKKIGMLRYGITEGGGGGR